jgi:hypothetical protein
VEVVTVLRAAERTPSRVALSGRAGRRLWIVAVLDMMAVAWMIAAGEWLDRTGGVVQVMTLGGHHELVLSLAAVGFIMLAGLAALTDGFTSAGRLELVLITIACTISIVALAGALSGVLIFVAVAFLLGSAGRLLLRH